MKEERQYHFIGIGGVGMSALAHILLQKGHQVSGSDLKESSVVESLKLAGAKIQMGHCETNIQGKPVVIYSTAINESNPEFVRAKSLGCTLMHRSDMLKTLLDEKKALVVTGSHGKTTVSSLLAYTLKSCGLMPSYVIGGFSDSLKHNGCSGSGDWFVAEGDESDGSFLKMSPFGGILTNVDFDHIGYYWKDKEELLEAFKTFTKQVKNKNLFFYWGDDEWLSKWKPEGVSYGFSKGCALRGSNLSIEDSQCVFDITYKNVRYDDIILNMVGEHNVLNALGVFGLAVELGIEPDEIRLAFESFGGARRRFEWKGEENSITVYDDYAHHPTELKAILNAVDIIAQGRRVVIAFQPHRPTRLKELVDEFAQVFKGVKNLVITDLYLAGEKQIDGINSELLVRKIEDSHLVVVPRDRLVMHLVEKLQPQDILLTLGAGDITLVADEVLQSLRGSLIR